ncbi:MAG: tRNA (N6-threonylcarbamoyladenosine(37)-N6)-methyltransferase TrmO [Candidatus Bathyarchaeia archaeon]
MSIIRMVSQHNSCEPKMKSAGKGEVYFIGVVEKAGEEEAQIKIFPDFCNGLKDVEEFSHLIVLYWFHLRDNTADRRTLLVFPKKHLVDVEKGVFACRSPSRPNPIGLCVVELVKKEDCILTVKGLDAFEGSPIIDIKPYIPSVDAVQNARSPAWAT